jgi:calcium/calmodulin-dependent protein kinase I
VHMATDRATGQQAAVKIMERAGLNESDVRDIKEEVSILMELDHPNIIKVFGFFEDADFFYIVTELMSGGELFDEIVEREFYWERDAQEVVKMLADALAYMHARGIVHRDLKPENVLLTTKGKDGIVKLADFGFAARTELDKKDYQLTTPCGTPGYVAPEIVSGIKYGREVDMWSLGVIAFILLGGYPPFHDDDQNELFRLIRRGKFTFDPAYWGMVSEEAKDCIRCLLTVDRTKRMTAADVKKHPWLMSVPETEEEGNTFGGVGGRGAGLDGRGPLGSVNLSPALKELRKFQARRRWKDGMAIALAREGQVFGTQTAMTSLTEDAPKTVRRMEDITQLQGLGTSDVLTRLQQEKRRERSALPGQF